MTVRRNFLLVVTVAAVAATPSLGAPATSVPDFSGLWAHPWLPGYEPMASGPTSLINRSRRNGVSNPVQLVGDYTNPILKPETAATVKKFGEMSIAYYGFPNPRNQCWPNGIPFVLSSNGMEIFQKPNEVVIIYQVDHQVRRIRMNAQHPAKVTPSYYGDSVGRYDGDTLVIDTIGINERSWLDTAGHEHSGKLHLIERLQKVDDTHLKYTVTYDDPVFFTEPWTITRTFTRGKPTDRIMTYSCEENNKDVEHLQSNKKPQQ
jgi:hypothetical protein